MLTLMASARVSMMIHQFLKLLNEGKISHCHGNRRHARHFVQANVHLRRLLMLYGLCIWLILVSHRGI